MTTRTTMSNDYLRTDGNATREPWQTYGILGRNTELQLWCCPANRTQVWIKPGQTAGARLCLLQSAQAEAARLGFQLSNLRQSRRLDGGGAAQSRMALRADHPRSVLAHTPPSWIDRSLEAPSRNCALAPRVLACRWLAAQFRCPTALPSLMTSGTVKLCESPGRAGGLPMESYLIIHTGQFPGGQIRGFLTQVPDHSATASLLMLAVLALLGFALSSACKGHRAALRGLADRTREFGMANETESGWGVSNSELLPTGDSANALRSSATRA